MPSLSEILQREIGKVGKSKTYIASQLGVSEKTIENYMRGLRNPKPDALVKLSKLLGFDLSELSDEFEQSVPHEKENGLELNDSGDSRPYRKKLFALKNTDQAYMVPLVPVAAQAGYAKHFYDMAYIEKLETYPIVPGIDPHGAVWRYFQVTGKSMEDTFRDGQFLLASQVLKEDWRNIENFYVYVIVTDEGVMIKRIGKVKGKDYWAAISDNEEEFDQFKIPVSEVKELWKYRRHIEWDASPPKKFEIKV